MREERTVRAGICGIALLMAVPGLASCVADGSMAPPPPPPPPDAILLGGEAATVFADGEDAYTLPVPALSHDRERQFFRGRALFRDAWVTAPSSTETRDGLGPLFNARACGSCHVRDGGGAPPEEGQSPVSLFLRLSVPGVDPDGSARGDPTYGRQFQNLSVSDVPAEGVAVVEYEELPGAFEDGEPFTLRRPRYRFTALAYGPMDPEARVSPRLARRLIGLGLLEAIPEAAIVANADEDDADRDGISGRASYVFDVESQSMKLGRFGWKATKSTVLQQTAIAFLDDIGITSRLFPAESCTANQPDCSAAATGGAPELVDAILENVVLYTQSLAVPARRNWDDPLAQQGEAIFQAIGCAACHVSTFTTGDLLPAIPELSNQTIRPYSDLLLHDMGEGLADGQEESSANGREWRTPPLWGIGLVHTVSGHTHFLNDGRARNFAEAILWHGGEAERVRETFRTMAAPDREALIRFLESL